MSNFPKKTDWWWVRINGEPTIVKAMFQCQDLWDPRLPYREVQVGLPYGGGTLEFGFMLKDTGEVVTPMGRKHAKHFEWVKPIPRDDVPNRVITQEQYDALPVGVEE